MTPRIAPLLVTVAAGAAAVAPAAVAKKPVPKGGKPAASAKVLRGALKPVRPDLRSYTVVGGSAQLTAGKRNANLVVKAHGLFTDGTYAWALLAGDCETGTLVNGFKYRVLRTDNSGRGTATAKSKKGKFVRDLATGYSVIVMEEGTTDRPLLCGALTAKGKGGKGGKGGSGKGGQGKGKGHD